MNEQNDHDILIRLDENVKSLTRKLDEHLDTNADTIKDHETRIRFIEKYVWGAIAIIGLINLVGAAYIFSHLR